MGASGNKTTQTDADVDMFLASVAPSERAADARVVVALMARLSGQAPRLWGPSIIGFGSYHYRYESGREGESMRIGFAPRKAELVLYLAGVADDDCASLGPHRRGKGCLYVKRLAAIDMVVLERLIVLSLDHMKGKYPE
ncbi:hypothetical protein J3E64_001139 [Sphingobium sp. OAS761]|uniref:DUF1801 domain-containing protein n=1 Tax=Sphingobium sp. OAS761 TaxID=2817901 RepID=UPI00209F514D|nr:DUF1801 domain-containing protein [Sphingobium sp. OAS761]MCP1469464.1 hypothetical protein [Sphingobium sp. OAS761]